jgi:hypothetical protein
MSTTTASQFSFLKQDSPKLFELATYAEERYRAGDAVGCVTALRTFGEEATRILLSSCGIDPRSLDFVTQARRIEELYDRGRITSFANNGLHALREVGNDAVHEWTASPEEARRCLEKAYEVALAQRSVLAPRARLNLKTAVEYAAPEFGEARLVFDDLVQENEQLRQQLEEVQDLLRQPDTDEGHAEEPEIALDVPTSVRLRLVVALCEAHRDLERLRQRARRERPRAPRSAARLSEEFNRARRTVSHLEGELAASFFVERYLATLLARRHKATQLRRRLELEGIDWPQEWENKLQAIEVEIHTLSEAPPVALMQAQSLDGVDAIHIELMDCMRRLVLADALMREFKERGMDWPVPWARSQSELKRRRDHLIAAARSSAPREVETATA